MTEFKVGDRITLTGPSWVWPGMSTDDVLTIAEVDGQDYVRFVNPNEWAHVNVPGYEVELNTDSPSSFEENVRRITAQIADLLIEKNAAYGDSALNPIRVFSKSDRIEQLNVRIDDKISRIQRGSEYGNEDTEMDLIGYLVLRKIARESE